MTPDRWMAEGDGRYRFGTIAGDRLAIGLGRPPSASVVTATAGRHVRGRPRTGGGAVHRRCAYFRTDQPEVDKKSSDGDLGPDPTPSLDRRFELIRLGKSWPGDVRAHGAIYALTGCDLEVDQAPGGPKGVTGAAPTRLPPVNHPRRKRVGEVSATKSERGEARSTLAYRNGCPSETQVGDPLQTCRVVCRPC